MPFGFAVWVAVWVWGRSRVGFGVGFGVGLGLGLDLGLGWGFGLDLDWIISGFKVLRGSGGGANRCLRGLDLICFLICEVVRQLT